eukprot:GFYU01001156.1.p1 GENE.GFYU01001156.1~~GFYU01001156.1.p1  ORF type:complete len:201 (-),score=4.50 GFYU01001156.1:347-949(-)
MTGPAKLTRCSNGLAQLSYVTLGVLLLAFISMSSAQYNLHQARTNSKAECSLKGLKDPNEDPTKEQCQLDSKLGTGSLNGLNLRFGESGCNVTLEHCIPGLCYGSIDLTYKLPVDDTLGLPPVKSFFKSFEILKGADYFKWTSHGIQFKPTESSVTLQYSTYTCSEFYKFRGRVKEPFCNQNIEVITGTAVGVPIFTCED